MTTEPLTLGTRLRQLREASGATGDDVATFHSRESADLFAAAPRVLAERDAYRKALEDLMKCIHPIAVQCCCHLIATTKRPCVYCRARKAQAGGKP